MERQGLARQARIVDEATFTLITDLEVHKAVRLEYFVSLLGIDIEVHSDRLRASVGEHLAEIISGHVRATDTISFVGAEPRLFVLFVGANIANMPLIIERLRQFLTLHAPEISDQRNVGLAIGASCFPSPARDREELFSHVDRLIEEARTDQVDPLRYRIARLSA